MIATTIGVAAIAAATGFLMEATRSTIRASNNSNSDLAVWDIYAQISIDSKVANGMIIYKDFTKSSFDPTLPTTNVRLASGLRGDALILTKSLSTLTASEITNIVGFYFDASTSTFRRFQFAISSPNTTDSIETILTNNYATLVAKSEIMATNVSATIMNPDPNTPTNPNSSDPNLRAFLCRDQSGQSGVLNILLKVSTGNQTAYKLIESAFVVRP